VENGGKENLSEEENRKWLVKVSSNDSIPLIYFPRKLRESFRIRKGDYFAILVDSTEKRLILQKVELPTAKQSKEDRKE
jgi:hypothetical protein